MQALEPTDWGAWFASYTQFVLRYADLAEENGVDIYQFADNLHTTYRHETSYRDLVRNLRTRFSGKLLVTTGPWYRNGLDTVKFWDCLDYIGICGSFHTLDIPYETAIRMTTDQVYRVYKASFESDVLPTARRFGKRILCSEVYYASRVGSTYSPSGVPNWGTARQDLAFRPEGSYAEQVRGHDAYMRVVADHADVYAGVFALQWRLEDPTWAVAWGLGTDNIYATPAEGLYALWWDGLGGPDGTPVEQVGCPLQREIEGFWYLPTFGGAQVEVFVEGHGPLAILDSDGRIDIGPNSPLDIRYRNPGSLFQSFCSLYLHLGAPRDFSDYTGILLTASSEPSAAFQIELDFGTWISCKSGLFSIGPERTSYVIPFGELRIEKDMRTQHGLGEKEIDLRQVIAIRVNVFSPEGTLRIYEFTPVTRP
jgi:hypothetical protein